MTPTTFTFKLTVPRDAALAAVVTDVLAHAVTYAEMDAGAGAELVQKVSAATAVELSTQGATSCLIVFACGDGELHITIGEQTVSQKTSA